MELISHVRRLQVLDSIAACGSFSGAADALQMTQSAVSQHVATLERALDLPLIERGTRPVQLTDAGFALVRHARALLARIGNAEQELGEITGRRNGRLRFGSFPTALATFVPAALARFQRQHADVSLTVIDDHLQRLLPRLDDGELDLAIIYDHPALPEVSSRHHDRVHLLDDAFQAVLPRGHRLARSGHDVSLTDLADQTWVGGGPASAWFRIVRHTCRAAGFDRMKRRVAHDEAVSDAKAELAGDNMDDRFAAMEREHMNTLSGRYHVDLTPVFDAHAVEHAVVFAGVDHRVGDAEDLFRVAIDMEERAATFFEATAKGTAPGSAAQRL